MKYLLLAFVLSGCTAMGEAFSRAGEGLQESQRQSQNDGTHLRPNYAGGFTSDDGQNCTSDYAGGLNCY